ncbi:MAG: HAD hydrolase-like protein [Bacteroidales bacterium]|nr:HAD hydrolase-like protein [Bacteroidales bacterium]
MIKLIIFDFDGTLADTGELILQTNQEVQRRMHYPVCDPETIMATVGLPLQECILTMYPDLPREELPAWVKLYREVFDSLKGKIIPSLFPGVRETLAEICRQGRMCTVASSRGSVSLNAFLCEMGIAQYISYVLGAEDVALAKPNPEPVLKTLRDLSASASETLVVGDMPVDIMMGAGAKALTCGVSYGNSDRDALQAAGADYVIDDFSELLTVLSRS